MVKNSRLQNRRTVLGSIAATVGVGLAGCADDANGNGDDYPSEDITFIVPFSEGGGSDIYARQVSSVLQDELGVNIQVDNQPGAGSLRGTGMAHGADPDGYTINIFNPPSTPTTWIVREDQTDWDITDFRGIGHISEGRLLVVANNDVSDEYGIEELGDVFDLYDSDELVNVGGQGIGGWNHIAALSAREQWDWNWDEYVGYDGSGPALQAILSGEVPVGLSTDATAKSAIESGEVNVIATLSTSPSLDLPDVPTATDHGYDDSLDFVTNLTRCIWAPPETPDDIIQTLTTALEAALDSDDMAEWSEEGDRNISYGGPEAAEAILQANIDGVRENVDLDALRDEV